MRRSRFATLVLSAGLCLCFGGDPDAGSEQIGVDDQRLSDVGGLGDAAYEAYAARVAYDSTDRQYLVVWAADDPDSGLADDEFEILGQRVDAVTGAEIGEIDFLISSMGGVGDPNDSVLAPAVAYNPIDNQYLVVWSGTEDNDGTALDEWEIYVQRLDAATGEPVGTNDQRISAMGGLDSALYSAWGPAVAFDPVRDQYLVAWWGSHDQGGQVAGEFEIFVQRLDGATGAEIGVDDQRISAMGGLGDLHFDARAPAVVFNPLHDEFLVAWQGDESALFQADDEFEIFVQRLSAVTGAELGGDDQRVTFAGPNLDPDFDADTPQLAFDPAHDRYLLVWSGDDDGLPLVDDELEIWGQLLEGADASLIGTALRLSDAGPTGSALFRAVRPAAVWSAPDQEFLVVWDGTDDSPGEGDNEIFLQRVGPDGFERGLDDERLSAMGADGSIETFASDAGVACAPERAEALVVWTGVGATPPLVAGEREVYGQRWIQPSLFADGFEVGDTSRWSLREP